VIIRGEFARERSIAEEFQQECPRAGTCNRGSTGETEQVETWAWVERLIFLSRTICPYTGRCAHDSDGYEQRANSPLRPDDQRRIIRFARSIPDGYNILDCLVPLTLALARSNDQPRVVVLMTILIQGKSLVSLEISDLLSQDRFADHHFII